MAGELTERRDELATLLTEQGLAPAIQPLVRRIYLFDSYVAGTTHLEDASALEHIAEGEELTLQREENKFDSNAILVLNSARQKLGYIPEKDNLIFSRLLDAGKLLTARISGITRHGSYVQIAIGIYLLDF